MISKNSTHILNGSNLIKAKKEAIMPFLLQLEEPIGIYCGMPSIGDYYAEIWKTIGLTYENIFWVIESVDYAKPVATLLLISFKEELNTQDQETILNHLLLRRLERLHAPPRHDYFQDQIAPYLKRTNQSVYDECYNYSFEHGSQKRTIITINKEFIDE